MQIAVFIEERNGLIKGSFRAKDEKFRVDILAKEFNGGGHACAAGFNVEGTMDALYPKLIQAIESHLQRVERGEIG